jgi:hypothetical protein
VTRYFLDEDLSQDVAVAARSLDLDVESAQELGRRSIDDAAQLLFAAERGRCLVSHNARDFYRLSLEFQQQALPHAGVLLVPPSFRGNEFMAIATALADYARQYPAGVSAYFVDYLRRTYV